MKHNECNILDLFYAELIDKYTKLILYLWENWVSSCWARTDEML